MNLINIPNRITQPSKCCIYCGKGYKSRNNYDKHIILCELIDKSKKKKTRLRIKDNDEDEIPSNRRLYNMLLELGYKYSKMEKQMEEINKFIVKKRKKINIIDWLNSNINPKYLFEELPNKIDITNQTIEYLLNNTFSDTVLLLEIFSMTNTEENPLPLFAFSQKQNTFYIYDKGETNNEWQELSRPKLTRFLNSIQMKISKGFYEWKKNHKEELSNDEVLSNKSDKTLVKIMSQEFKEDKYYTKMKTLLYNKMKVDIKAVLEYEFEF